jgi:hypothetical protein
MHHVRAHICRFGVAGEERVCAATPGSFAQLPSPGCSCQAAQRCAAPELRLGSRGIGRHDYPGAASSWRVIAACYWAVVNRITAVPAGTVLAGEAGSACMSAASGHAEVGENVQCVLPVPGRLLQLTSGVASFRQAAVGAGLLVVTGLFGQH